MQAITSSKTMTGAEKDIYEGLIPNSANLLQLLEQKFKNEQFDYQYINILFSFRSSTKDFEKITNLVDAVLKGGRGGFEVDIFCIQKTLKDYVSNIHSTYEYLEKLTKQLKRRKGIDLNFDEKDKETSRDIGEIRNEVLHQKIPGISVYISEEERKTCPAYASGITRIYKQITIEFKKLDKDFELGEFMKKTYNWVRNLIEEVTKDLLHIVSAP
jgi:hypothetical protein